MKQSQTKRKQVDPLKRKARIEEHKRRDRTKERLVKKEQIAFIDENNIDDLFSGLFKFPDEPYEDE